MFPDYKCKNIHDQQKKGMRQKQQQQQQQQAFAEAPAMVREARSTAVGGGEAGPQQPMMMVVGQHQHQMVGQQHMVGQHQQQHMGGQHQQQLMVGQQQPMVMVQQPVVRPMMVPMYHQGWPGPQQ